MMPLWNVAPAFPGYDALGLGQRNPESCAESGEGERTSSVEPSDLNNVTRCQLRLMDLFPAQHKLRVIPQVVADSHAVLGEGITNILFLRSREEVTGIAANPVVTFVADAEIPRTFPVADQVSDTVGRKSALSDNHSAIAARRSAAHPGPTGVRSTTAIHLRAKKSDVPRGKNGEFYTIVISHWGLLDQGLNRQSRCGADTLRGSFHLTPQRRRRD